MNTRQDVCICDTFMISGYLPTLAPAVLKTALNKNGFRTKVFYPSMHFFQKYDLAKKKDFMRLVDDIPLQIVDFLFSKKNDTDLEAELARQLTMHTMSEEWMPALFDLRNKAQEQLRLTVQEICACEPIALCASLTFGGYNFFSSLFSEIKNIAPDIRIIVGGSNCTPDFSQHLLAEIRDMDYVLCEEGTQTLVELISSIKQQKEYHSIYVSSKSHTATDCRSLKDLEETECPDFDDYFDTARMLGLPLHQLTLPYEISRGCWWCEKKPCVMCGFYGIRHQYISKSQKKVYEDLRSIKEKYGVHKFRFTDLVQPPKSYLKALHTDRFPEMNIFWELRPDIDEESIIIMKELGLTFAQIGLENLHTHCLKKMNKGTTGIYNIYLLLLAQKYKIDLIWNYLYGFPWDESEWYESVLELIPLIYHLQPPIPRKVWINQYSDWYEYRQNTKTTPGAGFLDFEHDSFHTFFETISSSVENKQAYEQLISMIGQWHEKQKENYSLYIDHWDTESLCIVRAFETKEIFTLTGLEKEIYLIFQKPMSIQAGLSRLANVKEKQMKEILGDLIQKKIMVYWDDEYLSLAVGHSPYRWISLKDQVMYMEEL